MRRECEREKWNVIMICIKLLNINTLVSIENTFFGWFIFITFARYLKEFAFFFCLCWKTFKMCLQAFFCVNLISLANFKDLFLLKNLDLFKNKNEINSMNLQESKAWYKFPVFWW